MKSIAKLALAAALPALIAGGAVAQEAASPPAEPQAQPFSAEAGAGRGFEGYVSARPRGMGTGGSDVGAQTRFPMVSPDDMPAISTGTELNVDKIEGFNEAIEQVFPMTPDMVRQYQEIYRQNEKAMLERAEPVATIDTGLVSLEPGEPAPSVTVAGGIASVIGFYDATGQSWPVAQYVIGSGDQFQVIQLGEDANNLTVTPLVAAGWTNLVVMLKGEPKPIVIRLEISDKAAHYRRDIQVMRPGPNASYNTAAGSSTVTEAGSLVLLAALTGVDLPSQAKLVAVTGVPARAWLMGDSIYLRSQHALLSPSWSSSMSGPDGIRVYQIPRSSFALFSVDGQIVRADIALP